MFDKFPYFCRHKIELQSGPLDSFGIYLNLPKICKLISLSQPRVSGPCSVAIAIRGSIVMSDSNKCQNVKSQRNLQTKKKTKKAKILGKQFVLFAFPTFRTPKNMPTKRTHMCVCLPPTKKGRKKKLRNLCIFSSSHFNPLFKIYYAETFKNVAPNFGYWQKTRDEYVLLSGYIFVFGRRLGAVHMFWGS